MQLVPVIHQGDGQAPWHGRGYRVDGRWKAQGGPREESTSVRLHVLWATPPLYYRHHERTGVLHLFRYPLQSGRGHREHGQQQHHSPGWQDYRPRGVCVTPHP